MSDWIDRCHFGDCRDLMRAMVADGVTVQTIVTSPPYWGLRDYGVDGQIGMEPTLREFIDTLVDVFELCRELLADDGTAWVNMGDAYVGSRGAPWGPSEASKTARAMTKSRRRDDAPIPRSDVRVEGLKPKDLMGQPWRLAFALQDAGWYLRQDIVWHKPNPMPESIKDRCTKSHEYLFLLSKNLQYFFDSDAISEASDWNPATSKMPDGWDTGDGAHGSFHRNGREKGSKYSFARETKNAAGTHGQKPQHREDREEIEYAGRRNKRTVWTIATQSYSGAHFATFPERLVEPCVLAGSRVGDVVFDPFFGSGTTGQVARRLGRHFVGCELNRDYEPLQRDRLRQPGLTLEIQ